MSLGTEIRDMVLKELIHQVLEKFKKDGRYDGNHPSSDPISIWERRRGQARGTAYRALPDPNPHQRRKTDFGTESKAA